MNKDFENQTDFEDATVDEQPDEFYDGLDDEILDDHRAHPKKRKWLFCFHCNRPESHALYRQNRWYYSFLIGLTFGLVRLIGPFQCQCCGATRLMSSNFTSLSYWFRKFRDRKKAAAGRR